MSYVELKSLYKIYKQGQNEVFALNGLSALIEQGEFLAILGPSGSGKSTLLHILGGLDSPTKGSVIIDGADISEYSDQELAKYRRKTVGFVFQSFNLLPALTVQENIEMPVLIDEGEIDKEYLEEIEKGLEIADLKNRLPSQISGGQMQRVAIARALANKPTIILADEPTGNLDSEISEKVLSLFLETCRKYGQTLVMITHNEEIAAKADRIIRIRDGKIQGE
ncbi:MAG: ABC transporter ATP-binding protein [Lachnospiraceae bacterium]|nr:ABC transporter ATP-binding protein [Lachnospiraceae bacterium]